MHESAKVNLIRVKVNLVRVKILNNELTLISPFYHKSTKTPNFTKM